MTDILHATWLVPNLLHRILLRQLWLRCRKYYTRQPKAKHCLFGLISTYNVRDLNACRRLQIDTFAALEDTEQDRACAPIGSD